MALNPDMSDVIIMTTEVGCDHLTQSTKISFAGAAIQPAACLKSLDVIVDLTLLMDKHVNSICSSAILNVRAPRHVRSATSADVGESIACAIISPRLDYYNSMLYGKSQTSIVKLQRLVPPTKLSCTSCERQTQVSQHNFIA